MGEAVVPSFKTVTLKYFEPGHTFMSADSFHALCEREMKTKNNIYDFNDYRSCIEKYANVFEMTQHYFYDFKSHKTQKIKTSNGTTVYLADIHEVQFKINETMLFLK